MPSRIRKLASWAADHIVAGITALCECPGFHYSELDVSGLWAAPEPIQDGLWIRLLEPDTTVNGHTRRFDGRRPPR